MGSAIVKRFLPVLNDHRFTWFVLLSIVFVVTLYVPALVPFAPVVLIVLAVLYIAILNSVDKQYGVVTTPIGDQVKQIVTDALTAVFNKDDITQAVQLGLADFIKALNGISTTVSANTQAVLAHSTVTAYGAGALTAADVQKIAADLIIKAFGETSPPPGPPAKTGKAGPEG